MRLAMACGLAWVVFGVVAPGEETVIPDDFPRFIVPDHEKDLEAVRQLMWRHYQPAGPLATMWDEWMASPTLWPGLAKDDALHTMRGRWRTALAGRIMDADGYVATHQHNSIAHQLGWPFPFWAQGGPKTWGWHFSLQNVPEGWHGTTIKTQDGWTLANADDDGIHDEAWNLKLAAPCASVTAPPLSIDARQSPFLQLRWRAAGLGSAQPYVAWTTKEAPEFGSERRCYFAPIESSTMVYTMIPLFRHPKWNGEITGLRIGFNNATADGTAGIQAFFTQYDTRHNINNASFVMGCADYFLWTRDLNLLREQINRMRMAIRYVMTVYKALDESVVVTPYPGHEGRSGIRIRPDGSKEILPSEGIGGNYWDLLPMGNQDAYATIHYYDALNHMIAIEQAVAEHPEWNIPGGPLRLDVTQLRQHAEAVRHNGNKLFWNSDTQRFYCAIDADGQGHDYGFTFLNLEAIQTGFATDEHADAIMKWIEGERTVEGDTSQGADIYHWRFAPRATTRRNVDYYFWGWSAPESIPWGYQVQDGGAVLGFSYHDLMARLKIRGADDAWKRLAEIVAWYREIQTAGGYRAYYDGSRDGSMQGGGKPGGLGLDMEFFESLMTPQIVIEGFLGLAPTVRGCRITPNLPSDWPELTITRIHVHNVLITVRATKATVEVAFDEVYPGLDEPFVVETPYGKPVAIQAPEKGSTLRFAS